MENDSICKMVCGHLESKCFQVDSITFQKRQGGGGDENGNPVPLNESSLINLVYTTKRNFYPLCEQKALLRATMEDAVPGSTADLPEIE